MFCVHVGIFNFIANRKKVTSWTVIKINNLFITKHIKVKVGRSMGSNHPIESKSAGCCLLNSSLSLTNPVLVVVF